METETLKNTVTLTDDNFENEVVHSDIPVLVDFWADWCGPCKVIGPTIESLATDYLGKVKVAKLNVDDNPQAARRFGVRSIPTLIVFKDGEVQQSVIGIKPKGQLADLIERYIH